ncbi:MAG: LysR family transcriptional regulator [Gammaproteobacteria bacterium]|nr:LysR family transcriptional regulator [Gammaproteobacteria bacterium]
MNIKDLRYIAALAETRHFGRAAQACHVSQPTLSSQVRKLEDELGTVLFERSTRGVEMTAAGTAVVREAHAALEQIQRVADVARALGDPMAGTLRLGMIPTLAPSLVPLVIKPLISSYPSLSLVITEDTTATLVERLRIHQVDAILIATSTEHDELAEQPLFEEPFWLVHPQNHTLYEAPDITLSMLRGQQMLLLSEVHCLADQVGRLVERYSEPGPHDSLRAASLETLLQLVSAGFGLTMVPALTTSGPWTTDMGLIAKPIRNKTARRTVRLVWRASFPNRSMIGTVSDLICRQLPNTVKRLYDA